MLLEKAVNLEVDVQDNVNAALLMKWNADAADSLIEIGRVNRNHRGEINAFCELIG